LDAERPLSAHPTRSIATGDRQAQNPGMTPLLLPVIFAASSAHPLVLPKPLRIQVATAHLGFSGATLSVRSVQSRTLSEAVRTLVLKLPDGAVRAMRLDRRGGFSGESGLNLYHVGQDSFRLIGPYDCAQIDPIRGRLTRCDRIGACALRLTFIGRYDWMNGFDPPHGRFGIGFRFLPPYDALESEGC
jgi:hypothetical protein